MTEKERRKRNERIQQVFREVGTIKGTARSLKLDRRTVRKVLQGKDGPRRAPRTTAGGMSKLASYYPLIQRWVVEDGMSAVLVFEELRKLGYTGGYSILTEHVRTIRPASIRRATTRLEHPPGEEGQVDWSPYTLTLAGETTIVQVFSMVLPFSRYLVMAAALDTQLPTLISMHELAFSEIGGYPALMTYDNMTTVGRHTSQHEVWLNAAFEAYRKRCGFEIRLTDPGQPTQHGSVERCFHYFEHNCLKRRRFTFESMEDLQAHIKWWCAEVANVRRHGSTRERPIDRFQREKGLLLPLSTYRETEVRTYARTVGTDFCVALATNRYSVPPRHVGQPATLRVAGEDLTIIVGGSVVARHIKRSDRHQRVVLAEHEEAFKKSSRNARLLEQVFVRLGPVGEDYYQGLRASRGRGTGYHLSRLLKLCDRYGIEKVTGAMAHTARYGNYSAEAVVRVLGGQKLEPTSRNTQVTAPPPERVRRWLEGLDVERGDLRHYDRLVDSLKNHPEGEDE